MYTLPPVNCRYGAPMGRACIEPRLSEPTKVPLRRVPLNSGGYDAGGAYWGLGAPLWHALSVDGRLDTFFRARNRSAAKAAILADNPLARFFR